MPVQIDLLGGLSVRGGDGTPLVLPTRKAEALLAYLACRVSQPQRRDRLACLLWGDGSDEQARHSLSQALTALRRLIPDASDWLDSNREAVCLRAGAGAIEIDVLALQELTPDADEATLARAVARYRGPLLEGCGVTEEAFEEWRSTERAHFQCIALDAALRLADLRRAREDGAGVIAALQAALVIDPAAEEVHRRLIAQQMQAGAFNDAIRAYRDCRDMLRKELGTQPEPATVALYREATRQLSQPEYELPETERASGGKASLAVMPFADEPGHAGARGNIAAGLVHDVITRLAKLRSLFVIAQGTVFALRERGLDPAEAGRRLRVDYVASGSVRLLSGRLRVHVELVDTRTARIVWADVFERPLDDTLEVLEEVGNQLVASLAGEIEAAERKRAVLKPPTSLTAWEAHHRGLWHMYRFNAADNDRAQEFFRQALRQDPTFSRAYAGLSFTHWQNAFLLRPAERLRETDAAFEMAGESLAADDHDPAAHLAMGRALWLRGEEDRCLRELQIAVDLSPNFALGHYMLGFVHCQSGDANIAIEAAQRSGSLSPYDPLKFGMLASRGLAHVRRGEYEVGADWAVKATTCPNAHAHILAIAAHCLVLAGRIVEARNFLAQIRQQTPGYGVRDLLGSFRFAEPTRTLFLDAAQRIGSA